MYTANIETTPFSPAYGIDCGHVPAGAHKDGIYPTFCRIPTGGRSKKHAHFEPEIFYIIEGKGALTIGEEEKSLRKGDLVHIPPYSQHELINTGAEDLLFLSVYSEDLSVPALPDSALITAAPPTPNGPLHLGHMSGPYLASDVLRRQLILKGKKVRGHSGTDDHQNYVKSEASRVDMRKRIIEGLRSFNIEFDEFIEPRSDLTYQKKIQDFVVRSIERGIAQPETLNFPYCEGCEKHLVDLHITGHCPGCHEESRGGCETCGLVVPPWELHAKHCSECGAPAGVKETKVHTFDLGKYLPLIKEDLGERRLPLRIIKLIDDVIQRPEFKVLLTFDGGEGIKIPHLGESIHVWFEMAAHYEEFAKTGDYWIHTFGFDNAFYYVLFIPAILKALENERCLPDAFVINEFLNLEGKKFSTSRNHAIWADEVRASTDLYRFFLALERPSNRTTNFGQEKFDRFSIETTSKLKVLQERARGLASVKATPGGDHSDVVRLSNDLDRALHPVNFDLRLGARLLLNFMDLALNKGAIHGEEKLLISTFARALWPLMPVESNRLRAALGDES